jgi:Flp pilus assembly protein TadD
MRHGVFAYESTLKVPLFLWSADLPRQVFAEPVRQVDLMPTVLDLLGVAEPPDIDGKSMRPYLNGELPFDAPPSYFEALNAHLTRDWAPLRGWIRNGYKLIDLPLPELYDLRRDPEERDNLHDRGVALAGELRRELGTALGDDRFTEPAQIDDETAQRLRSLGYLSAPEGARRESYSDVDDPKRRIHLTNLYEDAAESFRLGQADLAIERLRELVTRDGGSAEARLALAYVLYESGRIAEAIRGLEQAIEEGIESVAMDRLLGVYLLQSGDVPRAVRYLEEAVRRDPLAVEARNFLAVGYSSLGRHDEARSELAAVLTVEPMSTEARTNLGTLELTVGRFDEAIAQFQQALARNPDLPGALNGLGAAYLQTGNIEGSLASWRRAVEIDPQQYDALFNLAITLAERNPADAVPYLERFAATAPPTAYAAELAEARRLLKTTSDDPARR